MAKCLRINYYRPSLGEESDNFEPNEAEPTILMKRDTINIQLLIQGCKQNNRNSQRRLFEHFAGYALSICLRYTKNRAEAEEIINTGFLKIFNHIDQYDSTFPFRVWLRRIMINAAIDYHRANKASFTLLELRPEMEVAIEELPLPMLSPEEDVLPILQQLPEAYRIVFNLYVLEEYKHKEIAKLLGITESTSRSNLARAKEKLRTLMLKKDKTRFVKG